MIENGPLPMIGTKKQIPTEIMRNQSVGLGMRDTLFFAVGILLGTHRVQKHNSESFPLQMVVVIPLIPVR